MCTLQWDGQLLSVGGVDRQQGGLSPRRANLPRRAEGQLLGQGRRRAPWGGGGRGGVRGVVTEKTPLGAAGRRGAVAVMNRQRRGWDVWRERERGVR